MSKYGVNHEELSGSDWDAFEKIEWEDGVFSALETGLSPTIFEHPVLREKWQELQKIFVSFEKKIEEFESIIEYAEEHVEK